MQVLKVRGRNAQEALAEARRLLGSGVTVLHTKQFEDKSMLGLGRTPMVEILAAAQAPTAAPVAASGNASDEVELKTVAREVSAILDMLARFEPDRSPANARTATSPAVERLMRHGVSESLAEALVALAGSEDAEAVVRAIGRRLRCSGPTACYGSQARVALVGPTGAGKTTTAAKLAAQYALVHKKKIALVTLDTYRVGAVEQLATYARILEAPLEVGMCPEDVDSLVRKHQDKDLIIIDTVGRSQRDGERLDELDRLLRPARPTETHLTISAQASPAAQKESLDSFARLRPDRVILTKLDESPQLGCIVEIAAAGLLPFSYVTYGQEVPDDMAAANEEALSRLVWEGAP